MWHWGKRRGMILMRILIYGAGVIGSLYAALTPRLIQPTTFADISGNKSERTKQFYAYMNRRKKCGCKTKKAQ